MCLLINCGLLWIVVDLFCVCCLGLVLVLVCCFVCFFACVWWVVSFRRVLTNGLFCFLIVFVCVIGLIFCFVFW